MKSKKGMDALFKILVVLAVIIILVMSIVMLIKRLVKQSVDVLDVENFGLLFILPVKQLKYLFSN